MAYRRCVLWLLLGAGLCNSAMAEMDRSAVLELGYRVDSLDWNIAGWSTSGLGEIRSGQYVNVLSELSWSDVQIAQIGARLSGDEGLLHWRGRVTYGEVLSGDNQDSDYDYDNRQGEFSRSNNQADGNVFDASAGLGHRFDFKTPGGDLYHVAPLVGGSIHIQNMGMTNGYQTLYVPVAAGASDPQAGVPDPTAVGIIEGLDSSYRAEWYSAWLGVDVWRDVTPKLRMSMSAQAHWADYYAAANWNLRADFAHPKSFDHVAIGRGVQLSVNGLYKLSESMDWSMGLDYNRWRTGAGVDTIYLASGRSVQALLNEVNWSSVAISLGLAQRF